MRGYSPAQRVFGSTPRLPGQLDEEYFPLGEQSLRADSARFQEDTQMSSDACEAYHQASVSGKLSGGAREVEATRKEYALGEWRHYRRAARESKLIMMHWHGPAMVVCNEVSGSDDRKTDRVWVAHGPSLLRCTPEQMRPEFLAEARRREIDEPTAARAVPTFERVRAAMHGTRGPVNYHDLTGQHHRRHLRMAARTRRRSRWSRTWVSQWHPQHRRRHRQRT